MSFSLRGVAWTAFAVAVTLLVGCSIYLVRATNRFSAGEALVGHTREVQILVENMGAEVFQASNSAEAFVLTGDQTLLGGYDAAVANIPGDVTRLRLLTSDNVDRERQLGALESEINSELDLLGGFIKAHKKGVSSIDADARMARRTAELQAQVEERLE